MSKDDFKVFVPVDFTTSKSISSDEHGNYVRGFATTPDQDLEGDIILPENLDISYFMTRGYINYEHQEGNAYKIGVPTDRTFIDPKKGLYVEAKLFMDNPYAQEMWNLAKGLSDVQDEERVLGFSVEGRVLGRDSDNPDVLKGVQVKNVALTTNPANPNATWEALVKSLTTGYSIEGDREGGDALRHQELAGSIRNLSYQLKDLRETSDGIKWDLVAKSLEEEGRWDDDSALLFLQLSEGLSGDDANRFLKSLDDDEEEKDEEEEGDTIEAEDEKETAEMGEPDEDNK